MEDDATESSAELLVSDAMRAALVLLWQAWKYSQNVGLDRWNFAVEIEALREAGLTLTDLRWLIAKGYLDHATEVDDGSVEDRAFEATHRFRFRPESCFTLTTLGVDFVRIGLLEPSRWSTLRDEMEPVGEAPCDGRVAATPTPASLPRWDSVRRELWFGDRLVKRFRVPAPRQELVLTVFQEENWPPRIDDPLPPQPEIDSKRQLHATISSLNRHQRHGCIQFRGDGHGTGILWDTASGDETA